jgi:uncharacterized protein (TIGR00730 family)
MPKHPPPAYRSAEFLNGPEARPIRILSEYLEPRARLRRFNISLPFEQEPNPYITPELSFEFHYFFMRKLWFAYLGKALVVFPGGFGTLDELMEILTLVQTNKLRKQVLVIVYAPKFWKKVLNLEALAELGTISTEDVDLFQYAETVDDAYQKLTSWLQSRYLRG